MKIITEGSLHKHKSCFRRRIWYIAVLGLYLCLVWLYEKCATLAARPNSDHIEAPSWISPVFENWCLTLQQKQWDDVNLAFTSFLFIVRAINLNKKNNKLEASLFVSRISYFNQRGLTENGGWSFHSCREHLEYDTSNRREGRSILPTEVRPRKSHKFCM